jgi:hypothetical protein
LIYKIADITELAPEEEDNQLSVIAEITEPETNSNPGDSTLDGKSIGDNDVNVNLNHDEYLDQNEHLDEEHNQDAEMKDETSPVNGTLVGISLNKRGILRDGHATTQTTCG